jgi:hypothetical protein
MFISPLGVRLWDEMLFKVSFYGTKGARLWERCPFMGRTPSILLSHWF